MPKNRLKLLVQQRDNEIIILLNLINKSNKNNGEEGSFSIPVHRSNESAPSDLLSSYHSQLKPINFPETNSETTASTNMKPKSMNLLKSNEDSNMKFKSLSSNSQETRGSTTAFSSVSKDLGEILNGPIQVTNEQLMDRAACFEMFRKSYRKNEAMEEHKQILKEKYEEGQSLGAKVNNARQKINSLKNQIEQIRKEKAIIGLMDSGQEFSNKKFPEEEVLTQEIEKNKLM